MGDWSAVADEGEGVGIAGEGWECPGDGCLVQGEHVGALERIAFRGRQG